MHLFFDNFNSKSAGFQVGTGIGLLLKTYISNARKNITIVSPYISSSLMGDLRKKSSEGVGVQIISNIHTGNISNKNVDLNQLIDKISIPNNKGISELEILNADISKINVEVIRFKKITTLFLKMFYVSLIVVAVMFNFFKKWEQLPIYIKKIFVLMLIISTLSFLFMLFFRKIYKKNEKTVINFIQQKCEIKVEDHEYKSPFKLHVFYEFPFIHSKIYIIDNKTVFMGSFNYTNNGLFNNIETCIKSTDSNFINELNSNISELVNNKTQYTYKEIYEITK